MYYEAIARLVSDLPLRVHLRNQRFQIVNLSDSLFQILIKDRNQ